MNKKYVLKPWVKYTLISIVILVLLLQLMVINSKLNKIINNQNNITVVFEMRCDNGQ